MSDRNDTIQRIQVGTIGIVSVLLLVSVANFFVSQASDEQTANEEIQAESGDILPESIGGEDEAPAEPLAELGITPAPEPEEEILQPAQPKTGAGQVVPDLKPDPKLEAPMDREPQ